MTGQPLEPPPRRPLLRRTLTASTLALCLGAGLLLVSVVSVRPTHEDAHPYLAADADRDGLPDTVEQVGILTESSHRFATDAGARDTDGDGLSDGFEAGLWLNRPGMHGHSFTIGDESEPLFRIRSNPLAADTDRDGLDDGHEADADLDPFDPDGDDDTLYDALEVDVVGSDPHSADTDGDGMIDADEWAQHGDDGFSVVVADERTSAKDYAFDFAKGALAGDLLREDSLAWLAGNLSAGASSSVPVVGTLLGAAADLRDVVGSLIHGDWVGTGFSAAGAVPGGDLVAIPGKAAKFLQRNPHRAVDVAGLVATLPKVPEEIRFSALSKAVPEATALNERGVSRSNVLLLAKGRGSLSSLSRSLGRPGHVKGTAAPLQKSGYAGEAWLADDLGAGAGSTQKSFSVATCDIGCNDQMRVVDALVDGIAHESKVGLVPLTAATKRQIMSDAHLIANGQIDGAQWHFMASSTSNTLGPTRSVVGLLEELDIPYSIHLPQ